jgi:hypothetical protein
MNSEPGTQSLQKMTPASWILLGLFALVLISCIGMGVITDTIKQTYAHQNYVAVSALVLESKRTKSAAGYRGTGNSYKSVIRYKYRVNDKDYISQNYTHGWTGLEPKSYEGVGKVVDYYKPGRKVQAYYNPNNPAQAVLNNKKPRTSTMFWMLKLGAFASLLCILYGAGKLIYRLTKKEKG